MWSVFTRIWTEYGDLLRKSLYSVQIRGNTEQKKLPIWTLSLVQVVESFIISEESSLNPRATNLASS